MSDLCLITYIRAGSARNSSPLVS